jgi:hypothetical protein
MMMVKCTCNVALLFVIHWLGALILAAPVEASQLRAIPHASDGEGAEQAKKDAEISTVTGGLWSPLVGERRRSLIGAPEQHGNHEPQTQMCDTHTTLHTDTAPTGNEALDSEKNMLIKEYIQHHERFDYEYRVNLAKGTFVSEDLFTPSYTDAEFIYWGFEATKVKMSLSGHPVITTDDTKAAASSRLMLSSKNTKEREQFTGSHRFDQNHGYQWDFYDTQEFMVNMRDDFAIETRIKHVTVLDPEPGITEYIVFVGNNVGYYQHFVIDHLGYIAYLRKTMPPTSKLVLPDAFNTGGAARKFLMELDPEFAQNRVIFFNCSSLRQCNHKLVVSKSEDANYAPHATLKVVKPRSMTRHEELLELARDWVFERFPPVSPEAGGAQKKIVYYARNGYEDHNRRRPTAIPGENHSRAMDLEQESSMIQMIRNFIVRSGREEELVIFDGSLSIPDQIRLFQSASMVIGAHGGGLANLLFAARSETCEDRPKVLEFATNPLTPSIQHGKVSVSFYTIYSKCPWLDFHQLWYVPPSDAGTTFVDLGEFFHALVQLFSQEGSPVRNRSGVKLSTIIQQ